jgi:hypothetical protein
MDAGPSLSQAPVPMPMAVQRERIWDPISPSNGPLQPPNSLPTLTSILALRSNAVGKAYFLHVLGNNFSPGAKPTSAGKSLEVQVPSTPWRPVGALTGRRGPQGRAQFSPTGGSCACHLEVNLNTIWSYWPRNFQPMYLIDRSSAFASTGAGVV